jgi:hypothetical protein
MSCPLVSFPLVKATVLSAWQVVKGNMPDIIRTDDARSSMRG